MLVGVTGWLWLDAITAIGEGAAVIWSAWGLLAEAVAVNLDAAPRHIDVDRIRHALLDLPGVVEVEELHVWGVSTSRTALTAHILCRAATFKVAGEFLEQARRRLAEIGIRESTLQLETAGATAEPVEEAPFGSIPSLLPTSLSQRRI